MKKSKAIWLASIFGFIFLVFPFVFSVFTPNIFYWRNRALQRELVVGSSSEEIEQFFKDHHMKYVFHADSNSYVAAFYEPVTGFMTLQVFLVHVDKDKKFLNYETGYDVHIPNDQLPEMR